MAALDDVEYDLYDQMSDVDENEIFDEMAQVVSALLQMSPSELRMIPEPLMEQIKFLIVQGMLPDDIAAELRKKLDL